MPGSLRIIIGRKVDNKMSRRKQSNPKPIKRPEDDDEETDDATKLNQSEKSKDMDGNQSESSLHSESAELIETENTEMKKEPDSPVQVKVEKTEEETAEVFHLEPNRTETDTFHLDMSPRRLEMMRRLNFPSDVLTLRQVDEQEFLQTGIPWTIISFTSLKKGCTIGPYEGETVALSSIKPGELVLQFQGGDGDFSFIKVTEEAGAWLSLLRPADSNSTHNTQVVFEEGKIWCEIVEDLPQGTELLASFTTHEEESSPSVSEKVTGEKKDPVSREIRPSTTAVKRSDAKSFPQVTPQPALIYGCPFCGVRFSSRRTLEAHLTYYCSKKPPDFVSLQELQKQLQEQARAMLEKHAQLSEEETALSSPQIKTGQLSPRGVKRSAEDSGSESPKSIKSEKEDFRNKSPKTGDLYKCQTCTYVTDRASNLKQHQQEHAVESGSSPDRLSVSPVCQEESFCKECKIQFSSVSTFKGHKEFYCRFRQKSTDNVSELASPGPKDAAAADLTLKMLSAQGLALESSSLFLGGKGQVHPALLAANPLLASPLFLQDLLLKSHQQEEINKTLAKNVTTLTSPVLRATNSVNHSPAADEQPLDLSKSKYSKDETEGSKTADELTDKTLKTEPKSPPSQLSPVAKKVKLTDEKSPETNIPAAKTPLNIPSLHSPLLLGNQVQYVNKKPIPPLQSVSRCVECNIVFYKHENYLIHKEHYCSGRRNNKDSVSSDSDSGEQDIAKVAESKSATKSSSSDEEVKVKVEPGTKKVVQPEIPVRGEICYKYYCIPCKIKFSSAGTLKAHKEFYCPHGNSDSSDKDSVDKDGERSNSASSEVSTYQCEHCKNDFSSARLLKLHICLGEASPTPLLRCLYCDYVTQTDNRLAEHMKVHVPTKAFKCNLCGYRGNTARGMRMHGKMHMENGEEFTDDNMVEFEEPPQVPIQRNGLSEKGPVDMEAELIRMKNEPYKRRRSRKSFEKSENIVPFIGQNLLTQICAACGQTFANVSDFVIHLRMHEIAALEAMKNLKSLRCEHCDNYLADSLTSLLVHMQTKHPEQLPGTSKTSDTDGHSDSDKSHDSHVTEDRSRSSSVESSEAYKSGSSSQNKLDSPSNESAKNAETLAVNGTKIKKESALSDGESDSGVRGQEQSGGRSNDDNDLNDNLKSQKSPTLHEDKRSKVHKNLSSIEPRSKNHDSFSSKTGSSSSQNLKALSRKPVSSPQQPSRSSHPVKSEPKSPPSAREHSKSVSPPNSTVSPTSFDKLSPKLFSPDPKTRYLLSQNIKREQMTPPLRVETFSKLSPSRSPRTPVMSPKLTSPLGLHSPKLSSAIPLLYPQPLLSPYHFPTGIPISFIPTPGIQVSPPLPSSTTEKVGRKYCKHCDINFTYLSSFLTHKKYYCSARSSTDDTETPTATA